MPKAIDMVGFESNGTKVVSFSHKDDTTLRKYYNCVCFCGKEFIRAAKSIRASKSKGYRISCGCEAHGLSETSLYKRYYNMINRCYDPTNPLYEYYGGRGIKVCERWLESFKNFYEDMGHPPKGMTLDRIDFNGNYTPENCMWETKSNQSFNRRPRKSSKTGMSGVTISSYDPPKWRVRISIGEKETTLGTFYDLFEAACVRKAAELKYFPTKAISTPC